MSVTLTNLPQGGMNMGIHIAQEEISHFTYDAMHNLNKQLAEKLAAEIFKKNKKKILLAVDIDLITGEVQKILLEKIKKHSLTPPLEETKT